MKATECKVCGISIEQENRGRTMYCPPCRKAVSAEIRRKNAKIRDAKIKEEDRIAEQAKGTAPKQTAVAANLEAKRLGLSYGQYVARLAEQAARR